VLCDAELALDAEDAAEAAVARVEREHLCGPVLGSVLAFTILPSPILYGVWHTKARSVGGRILRNGRAIVLQ